MKCLFEAVGETTREHRCDVHLVNLPASALRCGSLNSFSEVNAGIELASAKAALNDADFLSTQFGQLESKAPFPL